VATGNELRFGAAGARVTATSSQLTLFAGDLDGDDLLLYAGNDAADGGIEIMGNAQMDIRSGLAVSEPVEPGLRASAGLIP